MGLSFAVPGDVDMLAVTAAWGQYTKQEVLDEDAKLRRAWAPGTGVARARDPP